MPAKDDRRAARSTSCPPTLNCEEIAHLPKKSSLLRKIYRRLVHQNESIFYPALLLDKRYQLRQHLSCTLYGACKLALDRKTDKLVCIKISIRELVDTRRPFGNLAQKINEDPYNEACLLRFLNDEQRRSSEPHLNKVVRFVDEFMDLSFHYLVTEYVAAPLSLYEVVQYHYAAAATTTNGAASTSSTTTVQTKSDCHDTNWKQYNERKSTDTERKHRQAHKRHRQVQCIFRQIALAIQALHRFHIVHRDLSLENILVAHAGKSLDDVRDLVLVDLGLAMMHPSSPYYSELMPLVPFGVNAGYMELLQCVQRIVPSRHRSKKDHSVSTQFQVNSVPLTQGLSGRCGYMSPELVANRTPWDAYANDVYALGCILYLLATGEAAYSSPVLRDPKFRLVFSGGWLLPPHVLSRDAKPYRDLPLSTLALINDLIAPEDYRLSIDQVVTYTHSW
jgi:serine/threonine protein kinase